MLWGGHKSWRLLLYFFILQGKHRYKPKLPFKSKCFSAKPSELELEKNLLRSVFILNIEIDWGSAKGRKTVREGWRISPERHGVEQLAVLLPMRQRLQYYRAVREGGGFAGPKPPIVMNTNELWVRQTIKLTQDNTCSVENALRAVRQLARHFPASRQRLKPQLSLNFSLSDSLLKTHICSV